MENDENNTSTRDRLKTKTEVKQRQGYTNVKIVFGYTRAILGYIIAHR